MTSALLLVALLTPAPHRTVNDMFVLAEVARKSYAQFPLNFEPSVTGAESKTEVTSPLEPAALPAVLAQLATKYRPLIDRVLARLSESEREEVNTHLQQDIRQAWITVSYAQRMSDAFVQASYQIYGKHPDHIWPSIVADRKERLGREYFDWYGSDDMPRPDVPTIPSTSSGQHKQSLVECLRGPRDLLATDARALAQGCTPDEALCCPDSPPRIPPTTTANADTHAAHGADLSGTVGGSVPHRKEVV